MLLRASEHKLMDILLFLQILKSLLLLVYSPSA